MDYTDPYGLEEARISFLEGEEFQQSQQGNVGAEVRPAGPGEGPGAELLFWGELLQGAIDFGRGTGDFITGGFIVKGGLTGAARDAIWGSKGEVQNRTAYVAGEVAGAVIITVIVTEAAALATEGLTDDSPTPEQPTTQPKAPDKTVEIDKNERTPRTGDPDSSTEFRKKNGSGSTTREYDSDGNATKDTDTGHSHKGSGDPHTHDWDGTDRGPGTPIK